MPASLHRVPGPLNSEEAAAIMQQKPQRSFELSGPSGVAATHHSCTDIVCLTSG